MYSILFIIFIAGNGRVHIAIGCNRTVRTIRAIRIAHQVYMKTKRQQLKPSKRREFQMTQSKRGILIHKLRAWHSTPD